MPTPREAATGAVIDGKLYVVGGWLRPANVVTRLLQVYDPVTDTWESRASMPTARQSPGGGVINGQLHIVGGESASGPVATHEVYDPAANTWTTAPPMPTKRTRPTADVINGKLYVAGGVDCIPFVSCFELDVLEVYSPTANQTCVPPPSGSVSWWDGDSVSGTTAFDISDGNNGTMIDGVSISSGIVGSAFNFDGSTGRINAGNPETLNFGTAGPFSLEAWFKWDGSGSSVNNIIRKSNYPVSGPGAGYWLRIGRDSHTLEFFAGETTGAPGFPKGIITTSVTPGVWHHVAGTRDSSGTMNLYLDGELRATTQVLNANTTSGAPFVLGAWDDRFGVIELFSGLMDEISVYNRALNASEVQSIFNAGCMGKCKGNGNTSPIAACNNVTVSAGPDCTASASIDNGSADPDGDPITTTQSPPGPYPVCSTSVTLTVTDSHGASSQCIATVTVIDTEPPVIACPASMSVEGNIRNSCSATVSPGSATATDNCTGVWVVGVRGDGQALNAPYPLGNTTITWTATDGSGNQSSCNQLVTVTNPSPAVSITGPATGSVFAVGTPVTFIGRFTDSAGGTHAGEWTFDSTNVSGTVNESTGDVNASYSFLTAGVYLVSLTVNDGCGGAGTASTIDGLTALVVVYDPDAGFVTGGGWIDSPAGAYVPNPNLNGRAGFGFVSRYQRGTTIPTGQTELQFRVANFNFHSTGYDWLVVAGARAQYKGSGTVNGTGNYGFMLTAIDGQISGGGGTDRFRIKIWDKNNGGAIVYDNQLSAPDGDDTTTALGGGSIVIHR